MKKLFTVITCLLVLFSYVANAATLDDKINKINASYEKRVVRIDNMKRASEPKKAMLKKHAQQTRDLRIAQVKDLDTLKPVKVAKKSK